MARNIVQKAMLSKNAAIAVGSGASYAEPTDIFVRFEDAAFAATYTMTKQQAVALWAALHQAIQ